MGVTALSKHALKHPKDTIRGARRASWRRRS
jgi:hypothetical protein